MEILVIKNKGVMEIEAMTMMGLSTKRDDDSKIGMFGTGNKYAISVFLREGYEVQIVTSTWHGQFTTKAAKFRNKEYEQVVLNAHKAGGLNQEYGLGMTSEMGLNWEIDDAMREFVCNAKDEGGYEHRLFTNDESCHSWCNTQIRNSSCTLVIIKGFRDKGYLHNYIEKYDTKYLFNRKPIWKTDKKTPHLAIYEKQNSDDPLRVYRNGVLVLEMDLHSVFDYEMNNIDIDEARSAGLFDAQWDFGRSLFTLPENLFNRIYDNMKHGFEFSCTSFYVEDEAGIVSRVKESIIATEDLFQQYERTFFSEKLMIVPQGWYDFLNKTQTIRTIHKMVSDVQRASGKDYRYSELDKIERQIVMRAVDFCRKAGYKISYREVRIKDLNGAKGWFHQKKIYLDKQSLSAGIQDTVNTLIHEMMHRDFKEYDYTASFQDILVREIVRQAMLRLEIAL